MRKAWEWVRCNDNLIMGWFWIALILPTFIWWRDSIMLVLAMSLYANIEASFGAHHAKKAEREREREKS